MRLVYDWGINDADYANWQCPIYRCWKSMIRRCHSSKCQTSQPTYIGCRVDERWRSFMAFQSWYLEQAPKPGDELDKDYLSDGKLYSPGTCCFISQLFNRLFCDCGTKRGAWPQGVSCHNQTGKFRARINYWGKRISLGLFNTPAEASTVYLKAKAVYVEELLVEFPQSPRLAAAIRRKMTELIERERYANYEE